MKLNPCNKLYACKVHTKWRLHTTREFSLYVRSFMDHEFGTHVVLSLLMTGVIFQASNTQHYNVNYIICITDF